MIKEYIDFPLRELNSFHVEEYASRIIEFDEKGDLDKIFSEPNRPTKWYVLGGGNNILFTQRYDGTLIHPAGCGITIIDEDDDYIIIEAEAAAEWDDLVAECVERGLWGAENLSLIPGSVGASPVQNIGAYGAEAKDIIHKVHYFDTQECEHLTLTNAECRFAYRDSIFKQELKGRAIITSVEFKLSKHPAPNLGYGDLAAETEKRGGAKLINIREAVCDIRSSKLPDPAKIGNAGSFFKNPVVEKSVADALKARHEDMPIYPTADTAKCKLAAGWLIDKAGLKGARRASVGVHEKQALVWVNYGGATGNDVVNLAREVQQTVYDKFGIEIEAEVNIL